MAKFKGSGPQAAAYAAGGPVTGRTRDFMKSPNTFTEPDDDGDKDQLYGKAGPGKGDGEQGTPAQRKNKRIK